MELQFQVLSAGDIAEVRDFALANLAREVPDETERAFVSWSAPWRNESLEHYLKLGWSFIVRREGKACGFFLGQPLLFFRGQTQTLWVEHIEATEDDVHVALVDVAVRVAREKHFQRVLFAAGSGRGAEPAKPPTLIGRWPCQPLEDSIIEVKTSKG